MNRKMIKAAIGALSLVLAVIPIALVPILLFSFKYLYVGLLVLAIYYTLNFIALGASYKYERTDIQAKITWTFIQIFLPGVGAYLYFTFARVPRKTLKLLKESQLLENEILNNDITHSKISLLENGVEAFPLIFEKLASAEHYINIQYFIMNPGIVHDKLFSILADRAKNGVKVKVLYDHLGNARWPQPDINKWRAAGIEIEEFRKIYWLKASGGDNFRSHNKIIVIDGKYVFFGGLNIGDEYFSLSGKYGDWVDTHYIGQGQIVEELDNIFAVQWHIETRKDISKEWRDYPATENTYKKLEVLYDSPERNIPVTYRKIIENINNAKTSIKIISPYVAFPVSFKDAIREALNRGVKIEVITIGKADKASSYYQSTFDTDTLTDLGVSVYRTNGYFIHTKMFIFDEDKVIIGTSNLDYRSFFHHFEINVLINSTSQDTLKYHSYFERIRNSSNLQTTSRNDWWIGRQFTYLLVRFIKGLF